MQRVLYESFTQLTLNHLKSITLTQMRVKPLTQKQRLKIYTLALKEVFKYVNKEIGLCTLLQDLACNYINRSYIKLPWKETHELFPEFGKHYKPFQVLLMNPLYHENKISWRIEVLRECIKLCTLKDYKPNGTKNYKN